MRSFLFVEYAAPNEAMQAKTVWFEAGDETIFIHAAELIERAMGKNIVLHTLLLGMEDDYETMTPVRRTASA